MHPLRKEKNCHFYTSLRKSVHILTTPLGSPKPPSVSNEYNMLPNIPASIVHSKVEKAIAEITHILITTGTLYNLRQQTNPVLCVQI